MVCTHPRAIPDEGSRGERSFDEATRETVNDPLWGYCEQVVAFAQADQEAFLRDPDAAGR